MAATELAERRKPGGMETAITESHGSEERRAEGNGDGEVKMSEPRAVVRTLTCERKTYVEGFALWRSIGSSIVSCCWPELPELDPILSLDEFEFSAPAAFPDHPHRGFENVTYMLEGGVSYHDFSGHKGIINAGDVQVHLPDCRSIHPGLALKVGVEALARGRNAAAPLRCSAPTPTTMSSQSESTQEKLAACRFGQTSRELTCSISIYGRRQLSTDPACGRARWLTAGRGVVHAEVPAGNGVQRGINIWVNLSASDKMVEPRYQDLASNGIPTAATGDGGVSVKVIAGECLGARSPLRPRTPALCLDVALRPGARLRQPVPRGWSACAYVIGGEAAFGDASAGARTLVVFGGDGDVIDVRAEAAGAGARVMLVAARPHGEAVVRDGPFVMNTREEVEQAREDFRRRRNGFEMADGWTSDHAATAAEH
ncbi:hypothetical protein C2845_PM14G08730 [Panicum miliaceum]|uniref:Pirin-like protein n=1 Tax=Panicum miliaceum TaxID=4540 RepID=A0A3L6PUJ4_PANMI|nr:hypothetical protein C2845_PM14G08730 [Panicum miliaceum]